MAERQMSGKALLDNLYRGLDTMPAPQAQMDARDFRRLTDDFLGKPSEPTASDEHSPVAPAAARKARSGSRARSLRLPLMIISSVALVGVIAAAALRDSDKRVAALPPPPPAVVPVAEPAPVAQAAEVPPPEPVVLTNPFDKTEKFTFPPGTSKADARDQMAAMLLQRAVDRGANRPKSRKLAAEPKPRKTSHGS
jgi:hypothetical protein